MNARSSLTPEPVGVVSASALEAPRLLTRPLAWVVVLSGLFVFLALRPDMGTDESIFMYIGREMHNGRLPYRDFWDHKGPGVYLATWGLTFVDLPDWGYHLLARVLYLLCVVPLLFVLAVPRRAWPVCLAGAAALVMHPGMDGDSILTEQGEACFLLLAITCLHGWARSDSAFVRYSAPVFGGGAVALAIAFRPTAALFLPALAGAVFLYPFPFRRKIVWTGMLLGACLAALAAAGMLASRYGLLLEMVDQALIANRMISTSHQGGGLPSAMVRPLKLAGFWAAVSGSVLLACIGRAAAEARCLPFYRALALLAGCALLEALLPMKSYPHYFLTAAFLLVPFVWAGLQAAVADQTLLRALRLAVGVLVVTQAATATQHVAQFFQSVRSAEQNAYGFRIAELTTYLRPGDTVWQGGLKGATLYWATGSPSASKHLYTGADRDRLHVPYDEIAADLARHRPRLIVLGAAWQKDGKLLEACPEPIRRVVEVDYRPLPPRAGDGVVYVRQPWPQQP